ncbi:acyl carrier protein [candidate division WOR-3 bacterium]|nr:acyl carrier protein [candidate division WOR-3 bacterium]
MMDLMDQIKKIIVEQLGVDESEVTPDAHFIDDLGADSLDTVELILSFEETFNISIPDEEAEKLESVGKALEYLEEKIEK